MDLPSASYQAGTAIRPAPDCRALTQGCRILARTSGRARAVAQASPDALTCRDEGRPGQPSESTDPSLQTLATGSLSDLYRRL